MWRGLVVAVVVAIGFLIGSPYFSWVLFRVMGEQTAWSINRDNTRSTLVWGPDIVPPDWVPVMPGTLLIKSGRWIEYEGRPSKSGNLELLSHDDAAAIVAWYAQQLAERGFVVAPTPEASDIQRLMAVEGEVRAANPSLGVDVRVVVRSRQGLLLRPRLVEVHWFDRPGGKS